jgi:hypothetical protein
LPTGQPDHVKGLAAASLQVHLGMVRRDAVRDALARSFASIVVTQSLTAEKERLKVVVEVASAKTGPYVLTYERKQVSLSAMLPLRRRAHGN